MYIFEQRSGKDKLLPSQDLEWKDSAIILKQNINKVCHVINGHGLDEKFKWRKK